MNRVLSKFAKANNMLVGVCDAERLDSLEPILKDAATPFVSRDIEKRLNPARLLRNAKSVIVVCEAYPLVEYSDSGEERVNFGEIAAMSCGRDYHFTLKSALNRLVAELREEYEFRYGIFVDSGALVEREMALKAGLGFIGKNCCLINEKFGSFFNIGLVVTDLPLELSQDARYAGHFSKCGSCDRCVRACPGGALDGEFRLDYTRCVSYLTQYDGVLSAEQMELVGKNFYGCDICQKVCWYNDSVMKVGYFERGEGELLNLLRIDSPRPQNRPSFMWMGEEIFTRNKIIALGNTHRATGDASVLAAVTKFLNADSEMLRVASAWAVEKIAT